MSVKGELRETHDAHIVVGVFGITVGAEFDKGITAGRGLSACSSFGSRVETASRSQHAWRRLGSRGFIASRRRRACSNRSKGFETYGVADVRELRGAGTSQRTKGPNLQ